MLALPDLFRENVAMGIKVKINGLEFDCETADQALELADRYQSREERARILSDAKAAIRSANASAAPKRVDQRGRSRSSEEASERAIAFLTVINLGGASGLSTAEIAAKMSLPSARGVGGYASGTSKIFKELKIEVGRAYRQESRRDGTLQWYPGTDLEGVIAKLRAPATRR